MKKAVAIAMKDLRSDARALEIAPAMAAFALSLVFLLTFALPTAAGRAPVPPPQAGAVPVADVMGVFIWAALLFAMITGAGRSASAEHSGGRIDALVLAPVDPIAIFAGKAGANLAFLVAVELVVIPAAALLTAVPWSRVAAVAPVALLASIGLAATGTLFGAATQYARARSVILPLLCFPVMLPLVLGASRLTSVALGSGGYSPEGRWFILMAVYDLVVTTVAAVTFEFVIKE